MLTTLLFLCSFCAIRSFKKRDYNYLAEYDTYCSLSVFIVRCTQLSMLLFMAYKIITLLYIFSADKEQCVVRLHLVYLMSLPFNAANGLVIVALWAEAHIQKCLVHFESNYTSSEVYYLYCNTQIFMRKENMAQITIYCVATVYLALCGVYIYFWVHGDVLLSGYIGIGTSSLQLLFYSWSSLSLLHIMRKRHDYEFQQKKVNMICIFLAVFILLGAYMAFLTLIFTVQDSDELGGDQQKTVTIYTAACSSTILAFYVLIIHFKSKKDCLQGISLLDYKFKTSKFQVYKEKSLNS